MVTRLPRKVRPRQAFNNPYLVQHELCYTETAILLLLLSMLLVILFIFFSFNPHIV